MKKNTKIYFLGSAVVALVAFSLYSNRLGLQAQMEKWDLVQKPAQVLELYFADYPSAAENPVEEKISFSFVIHDLDGRAAQVPYSVYFKSTEGQVTNIEEKTVAIDDGEYKKIEESYVPSNFGNTGSIFVVLNEQSQMIHFSVKD